MRKAEEIKTTEIVDDGVATWYIVTDGDEIKHVRIDTPQANEEIGDWTMSKDEIRDELIAEMGEHLLDQIEAVVKAW